VQCSRWGKSEGPSLPSDDLQHGIKNLGLEPCASPGEKRAHSIKPGASPGGTGVD